MTWASDSETEMRRFIESSDIEIKNCPKAPTCLGKEVYKDCSYKNNCVVYVSRPKEKSKDTSETANSVVEEINC